MQASEERFTAREAAEMCGFTNSGLQTYLDRGFLPFTTVPAGDRTWRMFTREQLIILTVFARLTDAGIKPSDAATYIRNIQDFSKTQVGKATADWPWSLSQPQMIPFPIRTLRVTDDSGKAVGEYINCEAINGYTQVIDLKAIQKSVDQQIAGIVHTRRFIALHPEEEE